MREREEFLSEQSELRNSGEGYIQNTKNLCMSENQLDCFAIARNDKFSSKASETNLTTYRPNDLTSFPDTDFSLFTFPIFMLIFTYGTEYFFYKNQTNGKR